MATPDLDPLLLDPTRLSIVALLAGAEWAEFGWALSAHKQLSGEATQLWRKVEAELVRRRPHFEERYSKRGYLAQLDLIASMLRAYEIGEQGHGLFVFAR